MARLERDIAHGYLEWFHGWLAHEVDDSEDD